MSPFIWLYGALTVVCLACFALSRDPIWVPLCAVGACLFDDSMEFWGRG